MTTSTDTPTAPPTFADAVFTTCLREDHRTLTPQYDGEGF